MEVDKEKSPENKRLIKYRADQKLLGRQPLNAYVTNEEKILILNYIKELRDCIPRAMEAIAVGGGEYYSVKELLRLMRLPERNKAITSVDITIAYKMHTNDKLGSYPVVFSRLEGGSIKGINYDN